MARTMLALLAGLLLCSVDAPADQKQILGKLQKAKVTLDLKGQPLDEVLRTLSKAAGVPIIVDPKVYQSQAAAKLKVTMKVENLSVHKALQLALDMTGLEMSVGSKAVRVGDRRGKPIGAIGQAHYVGDLMIVIRDFSAPRLGLMPAYPDRPFSSRELHGDRPARRLHRPFAESTYVPLGTPHFEDTPTFGRPVYRDRDRNAPWRSLANPVVLVARLKAMSGGERSWDRPGVGMRLLRGGRLWVVHTAAVQKQVAAAIARLRRQP